MRPGTLLFNSESVSEGHPESRPAMPGVAWYSSRTRSAPWSRCRPWSTTKGTRTLPDEQIEVMVRDAFPLIPQGIIDTPDLRQRTYAPTLAYAHLGHDDLNLPWEQTDRVAQSVSHPVAYPRCGGA